jgi:phosphatidylserine/phosphatidylglycerophosphate/cardiolipin synthase-like enzyme
VLIDGEQAMAAIAEAIASSREFVHITGWHFAAGFELVRGEHSAALGALLAEAAERVDVRVLAWAGAPVPVFHPTRSEVRAGVARLVRQTKIRCELDPREHPFHCHHEKTLVVDGQVAFVGGIDLREPPRDSFRLVVVLPSKANNGQDDTKGQLGRLVAADGGAGRLLAATVRSLTGTQDDRCMCTPRSGSSTTGG